MPVQDVGCCFGQELRKAILDGYPEADMVASDLTSDYWYVMCPCSLHTLPFGLAVWDFFLAENFRHFGVSEKKHREAVCTPVGQLG